MEPPALSPQGVSNRTRRWRRVRRTVALPVVALALAGCTVPTFGAAPGATTSSRSVYHLWQGFSIGAVIVGGLTTVLILWAVFKYRRKSDRIPKQSQYHIPLEMAYTIVPIIIVLGLFAATMVVENKEVANPKTNVTIDVNAFQWGWKFTYPGQNVVVVGQTTQDPVMVMPVNTNVHINLTSSDVLHGFYVHAFNFSRYALPGVLNQFTLRAVQTGTFGGQCTQLCGLYHSLMVFRVRVVSQSAYVAWLASNANAAVAQAAQAATGQQTSSIVPTKPAKSEGNN
ncbi:MAG TPA: cytochrome c oxidase subunit II [Acidimicrobiales bacterium]|nr:cytochrome c oxidase subunit II [Acidimicrobiales bacterium]